MGIYSLGPHWRGKAVRGITLEDKDSLPNFFIEVGIFKLQAPSVRFCQENPFKLFSNCSKCVD